MNRDSISSEEARAVAVWLDAWGAPRQFERGASAGVGSVVDYLAEKGFSIGVVGTRAGPRFRVNGGLLKRSELYGLADRMRVAEGREPFRIGRR